METENHALDALLQSREYITRSALRELLAERQVYCTYIDDLELVMSVFCETEFPDGTQQVVDDVTPEVDLPTIGIEHFRNAGYYVYFLRDDVVIELDTIDESTSAIQRMMKLYRKFMDRSK